MAKTFIKENGVISLDSVNSEEDLKARPGININPPPSDGRCMCCGKHISELKPYGKAGEDLLFDEDFSDALLLKRWRPCYPYFEEDAKAVIEAELNYRDAGYKEPLDWMIKKYGKKKGEGMYYANMGSKQIGSGMECRECFFLNDDEYFEKCRIGNANI